MAQPVQYQHDHQSFHYATASDSPTPTPTYSMPVQHSPFVNVTIQSNVFNLDLPGILDSGSTVTLIPINLLTEDEVKNLDHTDIKVRGVTPGFSPIIGKAVVDITLGSSAVFPNTEVFITKSTIPILIGTNVIKHDSVIKLEIDYVQRRMILHRRSSSGLHTNEVELLKDEDAFKNGLKWSSHITLQDKLTWLKNKGISLPSTNKKEELEAMTCLLYKYSDILGTEDEEQGTFIRPVRLPTNGKSKSIPANHVPQAQEADVDKEIQRMFDLGIIEDCPDPRGFNSPVYSVRKPNGKVRVVANFKDTLNKCLKDLDPYPMPHMDDLFNRIGNGNQYFATLDLKSGYWQIEIHPEDRHKTAFTWNGRCLQYTKVAFGLTCAGQIFGRCVSEALQTVDMKNNIITYVDDNLVFGKTFKDFITALEELFKALRRFGFKLNPAKCNFLGTEAEFLGRVVGKDGFSPNPKYVQGIMDMKSPTTRQENLKLVGRLVWIRQFLETRLYEKVKSSTFADLMKPIHHLNKSSIPFEWTTEAEEAFLKIKKKLTSSPIISFPDFNLLI